MKIWEIDKLQLFLVFFIPGFISIKIYDLLVPGELRDFSKSIFEAVAYSAINFALLSWILIVIQHYDLYNTHIVWFYILQVFVMFIGPIIWPIVFIRASDWKPIAKRIIHPIQKPWDWVFLKRKSRWVIIHLTNGNAIGGKYASKSFSSSFPAEEQIFLEEVWKLDSNGVFIKPIKRSAGIIVLGKEISSIEFFK